MRKNGFSLMELLITVSIIAVLVAIGIASYATINKQSRDAKRKSDIEQIRSALEMYRADNGYYPSTGAGSWTQSSDLSTPLVDTYMPTVPLDPRSTQSYMYRATNTSGGQYYGYCVSAQLETENPSDTCTLVLPTDHNYGLKHP